MSKALRAAFVRREALVIRVEVRRLHRPAIAAAWWELRTALARETPGGAGAVLTKPGRVSTARWRVPGERTGEEYARNRCLKAPQRSYWLEPGG